MAQTGSELPVELTDGNAIKNTGSEHVVRQLIRFRRKDGSEFVYSLGNKFFNRDMLTITRLGCGCGGVCLIINRSIVLSLDL